MIRVVGTAAGMGLSLAVMFAHLAMPAWSRFDIEPLWRLAETTRPSLQKGEPLVLYGIHPARTSVRFLPGHSELITETTDAPALEQVIEHYPRGQILAINGDPLPAISARARVDATNGRWVLWRFEH